MYYQMISFWLINCAIGRILHSTVLNIKTV